METPKAHTKSPFGNDSETVDTIKDKPTVVGIFGVPGCGKTTLLRSLQHEKLLGVGKQFTFHDGPEAIAKGVPGGFEEYQKLDWAKKVQYRELAIETIGNDCAKTGNTGIVAGHMLFWRGWDTEGNSDYTKSDLRTYTHILYLKVPPETILQYRRDAQRKNRGVVPLLRRWQNSEIRGLRRVCLQNGILFSEIWPDGPFFEHNVSQLLRDFRSHSLTCNLQRAKNRLNEVLINDGRPMGTCLVLDADKTLTSVDTGELFWKEICHSRANNDEEEEEGEWEEEFPLKTIFKSELGYSYKAFRQVALWYEEVATDQEFNDICAIVAKKVKIHPEFLKLLEQVQKTDHVGAVIITCGIRRVWELVLQRWKLCRAVKLIGGNRIADGFVVTPEVKGDLVSYIRNQYNSFIWAFGDSPSDLKMMAEADEAVIVVGDEKTRSKAMDKSLPLYLGNGLRSRQFLIPSDVSPRLDTTTIPLNQLIDPGFLKTVLCRRLAVNQIIHATEKISARLLMTRMHDARVQGPELRKAHQEVGWYLATEYLPSIIGLEDVPIPHVQGHTTTGHQLLDEEKTLIVALMRGGESMAFGVNKALPKARFIHAWKPEDITLDHLHGTDGENPCPNVILVDSIINTSKSIIEFVQHLRNLKPGKRSRNRFLYQGYKLRIVVVTSVVPEQSISDRSPLGEMLKDSERLSLVALRLSENEHTGQSGTDTGNRLFNNHTFDVKKESVKRMRVENSYRLL